MSMDEIVVALALIGGVCLVLAVVGGVAKAIDALLQWRDRVAAAREQEARRAAAMRTWHG
jgi:hypothetical protein